MNLYPLLIIFVLLFVFPVLLGKFFQTYTTSDTSIIYDFVFGFLCMLALWQLLVFPAVILHVKFKTICIIYMLLLIPMAAFSLKQLIRRYSHSNRLLKTFSLPKDPFSVLYASVFCILLLVQIYYAVFYSRTRMSADGYAVYAAQAVEDGYILLTNYKTGIAETLTAEWISRALQTELFFPGLLSVCTGIDAASVCHTVIYVYVLLLSYGAHYLFCSVLLKKKEDQWIFMILLSVLYIFGYHSHYSLTFRFLGPNDEGKAILAVVITPFMLSLIRQLLEQDYSVKHGITLMIVSLAGMSLTLGGSYTFFALLASFCIMDFIKQRRVSILLYMIWGGFFPLMYGLIYAYWLLM